MASEMPLALVTEPESFEAARSAAVASKARRMRSAVEDANTAWAAPKDGDAQAILARLELAATHSDFHSARQLAERVLAAPAICNALPPEQRMRAYLLIMETSTLGGNPLWSLGAQRLATLELQRWPPEGESRVRAELRMLELQAERARFYGDTVAHFAAVKRAAHFLLGKRFLLRASSRYGVVWEIVELLAACGLRACAYQLGRRMADLAATELAADAPVESLILANEALFDLPGIITRALGIPLPRLGASEEILPRRRDIQELLGEFENLARQANRIALGHWAPGWIYRAQRSVAIVSWALGGGAARNLIACMEQGVQHTRVAGLYARQRERERFLDLAKLGADRAASFLRENKDQARYSGPEGDYLLAAQHALAGRATEALAAYARYAAAANERAMVGQQALAADLLAMGEVLVALPKRLSPMSAGQDPIRVVCRSVRLMMEQGPSAPLADVAAEQGLTVRRVQQAFKAVGVGSPSHFVRRFKSGRCDRADH